MAAANSTHSRSNDTQSEGRRSSKKIDSKRTKSAPPAIRTAKNSKRKSKGKRGNVPNAEYPPSSCSSKSSKGSKNKNTSAKSARESMASDFKDGGEVDVEMEEPAVASSTKASGRCQCIPRKKRHRRDYYYLVLGLTRPAAPEHIHLHYQMEINRIRILQAQQNGSLSQEQKEHLAEINFAYTILAHTQKRKIYDTYGLRGVLLGEKKPIVHHSLYMIATKAWKVAIHVLTYLTCFWCGCCCCCGCCCMCCCRCCCHGFCGQNVMSGICELHQKQFEDYTVEARTITTVEKNVKKSKHQITSNSVESKPTSKKNRHGSTRSSGHVDRARLFIDKPDISVKHVHQFKPRQSTEADTADIFKKYSTKHEHVNIPELDMSKLRNKNQSKKTPIQKINKSTKSHTHHRNKTQSSMSTRKSSESGTQSSTDACSHMQSVKISSAEELQSQLGISAKTKKSTSTTTSCSSAECKKKKQERRAKRAEKKRHKSARKHG
ncbi:unnamed protein product [Bursaphelenchus okinawaensis]|uniref:J domain-containing protein n=1 Tax=Bursaphelenchus okinawaensis TaxID=465554 RepID=A0A811LDN5_9BILA|nr:unnamed protein product [Bursaphelenchus okinawaensis]CAG9121979.1 unnamed protein product [Bursaphelenchus okinawaensis]